MPPAKFCSKCGIKKELICFNNKKSGKYGKNSMCKECCSVYNKMHHLGNREKDNLKSKEYHQNNKEKDNLRCIQYGKHHKEEKSLYMRKYYKNHKIERKEYNKQYHQNNKEELNLKSALYRQTLSGKLAVKRKNAKRERNLGYNELNKWFFGCVGHHMNQHDICYIPENLHISVPHRQSNQESMNKINNAAIEWMMSQ